MRMHAQVHVHMCMSSPGRQHEKQRQRVELHPLELGGQRVAPHVEARRGHMGHAELGQPAGQPVEVHGESHARLAPAQGHRAAAMGTGLPHGRLGLRSLDAWGCRLE